MNEYTSCCKSYTLAVALERNPLSALTLSELATYLVVEPQHSPVGDVERSDTPQLRANTTPVADIRRQSVIIQ